MSQKAPLTLYATRPGTSGYGKVAAGILKGLGGEGYAVRFRPFKEISAEASSPAAPHEATEDDGAITLCLAPPYAFAAGRGRYRIGYTSHETTELPESWPPLLNRMDEIWVFSTFNERAFRASGVRAPIKVIPPGVNSDEFHPGKGEGLMELYGAFVFLSVGSFHHYKGLDVLIRAYLEEFRASDEVCLILKSYRYFNSPGCDPFLHAEKAVSEKGPGAPPLVVIDGPFRESLASLYRSADCYVSTSRGEGFCLPLLEAMACGIPVISSSFGGPGDYLTAETSYLADYRLVDVAPNDHPFHTRGQWAEVDLDHVKHLMRHVYEHRDEARSRAEKALDKVKRDHSAGRWAAAMASRLRSIEKRII
ncbi:MAG: glycosyltransferase [Candidatus Eremiobacteraeota bacterium]|nr:glycosyltransferase [Candidatus Eremiobacteraeota bacterium]